MEAERELVKLSLSNELIKAACILSMKAHSKKHYRTKKKKDSAGSSSSVKVSIIAFKGSMEVDHFYHDNLSGETIDDVNHGGHFGETNVDCNLFPSLQRIGEKDKLAKVNRSVLQIFEDLLINSRFKSKVEKAVKKHKKILFTGHSSGGAIASLATLWILDEYTRKRKIRFPIDRMQAGEFLENVLSNALTVASHDAHDLMEPTNSLMEKLSVDFVKASPYRPFGVYVFCTRDDDLDPSAPRQQLVVENPNAVLQLLFYFLQLRNEDQDVAEFALNRSFTEHFSYEEEVNKNGLQLENQVKVQDLLDLWTSQGTTYGHLRVLLLM
ncbi:hypothetical protein L1987_08334 [Smallanthus sonchifolius]|uniref:Uncharacterized protein n=1 Tax=Smallanthus sonchifolius TaxID=185202 RepID=A0ACB9JM51_9ASTR|nr:hypothetical protein L1987_08334 [Smallanthus sonchifolius]